MYNNIKVKTLEQYEELVKELLRPQLIAISEEEFESYFEECREDIEKDFTRSEPAGASMLAYALALNY